MDRERELRRLAMHGVTERLGVSFSRGGVEMRAKPNGTAAGSNFEFKGYAAVYDYDFPMWDPFGDPYTEYVAQGAFRRAVNDPNLDVPFLIGHNDAGVALARTKSGTMKLSEDSHGLHVHVPAMDGSRWDVQALASAVARGDQDEMSLAFICNQQSWTPDFERRGIIEGTPHRGDVCSVVHGANDGTAGAGMWPVEQLSFRRPAAIGGPVLLERRAAASLAVQHGHPGQPCIDPDGDGDCDQSPEGDTDHDYWTADGQQIKPLPDQRAASVPYELLAVNQAERDKAHAAGNSLPDKSYPINNVAQLHSAAVLAASHHGDWQAAQALIRRRAKELGVDVTTLPGFGEEKSAGMPLERLASAAESVDLSTASDYNPYTAPAGLTCPQCGAGNHGGAKFCSQCAHSFADGTSAGTSANVMVDDNSGIPGEETQFSASRRLELRLRELEMDELAGHV